MNTFIYGVFVSPRGGLGGPPNFLACCSISVLVIELWAVEAFAVRLLLLIVSVTFLCKHFMFFLILVYVYSAYLLRKRIPQMTALAELLFLSCSVNGFFHEKVLTSGLSCDLWNVRQGRKWL
jgi:hypothetical protein